MTTKVVREWQQLPALFFYCLDTFTFFSLKGDHPSILQCVKTTHRSFVKSM
jgi:hypothetical protein